MKIEKIPVKKTRATKSDFEDFVLTIKKLNVGESFFVSKMNSNHRIAVIIMNKILDAEFISRKEGKGYRIGRIA